MGAIVIELPERYTPRCKWWGSIEIANDLAERKRQTPAIKDARRKLVKAHRRGYCEGTTYRLDARSFIKLEHGW